MSDIDRLTGIISRVTGMIPKSTWENNLERAIEAVCTERGRTRAEVLERFESDDTLFAEITAAVTVGETFFYRHAAHFEILVDHLKALFAEDDAKRSSLRTPPPRRVIWSVGCASGEEPLSIAIALSEFIGSEVFERVSILASDVSARAIARAQVGLYGAWSFRGTPAWLVGDYFACEGRRCRIDSRIHSAVTFRQTPLQRQLDAQDADSVDVIFFRNVGIYFNDEALDAAFEGFARVLRPSGVLILAPADPAPKPTVMSRVMRRGMRLFEPRSAQRPTATTSSSAPLREPRLSPPPVRSTYSFAGARPMTPPRFYNAPASRPKTPPPRVTAPAASAQRGVAVSSEHREAIRSFADNGEVTKAIRLADELVKGSPDDAAAYVLRGQMRAARGDSAGAAEDLRAAIFLNGDDRVARYWYALALRESGRPDESRRQLGHLKQLLDRSAEAEVLEDGETIVRDLRAEVSYLLEM